MRSHLRFVLRSLRLILHVLVGLLLATLINLDFTHRLDPDDIGRRWCRRLLRILGVRFTVQGQAQQVGQVIVCNHVSWLDIPLVGAGLSTRFVAKSEIQHWPVAGWLARAMGTFYIRRGPGGSKPLLEKLRPHLAQGGSVVIFPEGTTTGGLDVLPFHARLFQSVLDANCPVQPVALRYGPTRDGQHIAPFIGDDTLVAHIVRLLRAPGLSAEMSYCPLLKPEDYGDRQTLARDAEEMIRRIVAPQALFKKPTLLELHERGQASTRQNAQAGTLQASNTAQDNTEARAA